MEGTAQTLEDLVARINQKGLQLAIITPASGFIGTHLAEALLAQNIAVICESAGNPDVERYTKHLQADPHFLLLEHSHQHSLPLSLPSPRYIILDLDETFNHFASDDDVAFGISLETKRILEYATTTGAMLVLLTQASRTSSHQQLEAGLPLAEETRQLELKRFVFTLVAEAMQKKGLLARIVTYTDLYGPRLNVIQPKTKTEELFAQAVTKHKIAITGDGLAPFGPIYISDFIYGIVKLLFLDQAKEYVYDFANPQQTNILHFAHEMQQIGATMGVSLAIAFTKESADDNYPIDVPLSSQSMHDLGWEPKVDTHLGLLRTLSFFFPKPSPQPQTTTISQTPPPPPVQLPATVYPAITKPTTRSIVVFKSPQLLVRARKQTSLFAKQLTSAIKNKTSRQQETLDIQPMTLIPPMQATPTTNKRLPSLPIGRIGTVLGVICIILGLLVLTPTVLLTIYTGRIARSVTSLQQNSNTTNVNAVNQAIEQANTALTLSTLNYAVLHKTQILANDNLSLAAMTDILAGLTEVNNSYQAVTTAFQKPDLQANQSIALASAHLRSASDNFSLGYAIQKVIRPPTRFSSSLQNLLLLSKAQQANITALENSIDFFNLLYGTARPKTFIVLVADNNELRPGGGVVSAMLTVTIRQGMKPIVAPYDFSDTSLGQIAAPTSIQTYLRRSNLAPQDILWYPTLHQATTPIYPALASVSGQPVTGVIGIDLSGLKSLIHLTGPISVAGALNQPSQTQFVSEQNFDSVVSNLYQTQVFATQQDRNRYIANLSQAIVNQVINAPLDKDIPTLSTLYAQQHMTVDFNDSDFTNFAQIHHIIDPLIANPEGIGVFDSNIGFNKVNTVIKRTIHQDLIVDDTLSLNGRLIITYANTGTATQWPFGTYQSATTILLPDGYKLGRILIDNKPVQIQKDAITNNGTTVLITVPPSATSILTIEYKRQKPFTVENGKLSLTTQFLKQSGTLADPYEVAIQHPKVFHIESEPVGFTQFADGILLKTTLDTTKNLSFTFSK